ncbi:class II glutamine amidotransferase domain-containing protein [Catelliglobosispora koreensis]|uniref:hypothetical protein n=1 Tax=Catelliglobosispora koreensis TaxID=129052 RepID=UPI0003609F85|nr:hypothetical protein [Catelliglobosispora koreensis]
MAGLAALLSFGSDRTTTQTLQGLSAALAPRGAEETIAEYGAARLLMRSALPRIHEIEETAIIVDGIAEVSSLVGRYLRHGPAALLHGEDPYALILADIGGLVLCRHLDGPPLYYTRSRGAVIVASEPSALLAAGVQAAVDETTVTRFLATGSCDEVPATFFQGIRRVLPGQVVEVTAHTDAGGRSEGWAIRAHPPVSQRQVPARMALLRGKSGTERTGVLMAGAGHPDIAIPTAALLGATISSAGTPRAVPVYSATFPGLTAGSFPQAVLGPLADSSVRHRAIPLYADEFDVDGYLADLGEPIPGLWGYLLWAIAKATAGEADVLLSAAGWNAPHGHLSRLSDRIGSRYGVMVRFPYCDVERGDPAVRHEIQMLAERTLPPASVRAATSHGSHIESPVSEVLQRLRSEIAGVLLYPRDARPDHHALATLSNLDKASSASIDRLWRRYVLERWLATVIAPKQATVPTARPASAAKPVEVSASGRSWQRRMLVTESFAAGDRLAEKLAWYVTEFATSADKQARQALRQPWYLLVAAKPVAVTQGRARAIWEIEPGRLARGLVRLAGQKIRHTDPWSMQAAIEEGGTIRVASGALCAAIGSLSWYEKFSGAKARSVSPPREHACPPAHLAVVSAPKHANGVASELLSALRRALPEEIFASLQGCAIVSADAEGVRQLGWAGAKAPAAQLIRRLCEGNPFGQGDERTPVLIALGSPAGKPAAQGKKSGKRQPSRRR